MYTTNYTKPKTNASRNIQSYCRKPIDTQRSVVTQNRPQRLVAAWKPYLYGRAHDDRVVTIRARPKARPTRKTDDGLFPNNGRERPVAVQGVTLDAFDGISNFFE